MRLPLLFLSSDAHAAALRIFEAVEFGDEPYVEGAFERARSHLSRARWSDYDGTYLALYTLALVKRGVSIPLHPPFRIPREIPRHRDRRSDAAGEASRHDDLGFLLDIGLVGKGSPYGLLDERGVARLINFRLVLEGLLPFEIHPSAVGIDVRSGEPETTRWDHAPHGMVAVTFDVALPDLTALGLVGGRSEAAFLSSYFTGETWKAVRTRFGVADVEVEGRTRSP